MIFICVGSREYQFNRLIEEIDLIASKGNISIPIFAQIGSSEYIPKYIDYIDYLGKDEFQMMQEKASLIITHGGTGSIITALKMDKPVISVPRLQKFEEHTDDHQLEVTGVLEKRGYLRSVIEINDLEKVIIESIANPLNKKLNLESNVKKIIKNFIEEI